MRSSMYPSSCMLLTLALAVPLQSCSASGKKTPTNPEVGTMSERSARASGAAAHLHHPDASPTTGQPSGEAMPVAAAGPSGISVAVDGFDYPVWSDPNDRSASWADDGDGYYGSLDFGEWNPAFGASHCGEDWLVEPQGSGDGLGTAEIRAVANGVVRAAGDIGGNGIGNIVVIDHWIPGAGSPGWEVIQSAYWHLKTVDVQVGDDVTRGETIGTMGDGTTPAHPNYTNYVPHLHFELRWDENVAPDHERGYGCSVDQPLEMTDPSEFIDSHRKWP